MKANWSRAPRASVQALLLRRFLWGVVFALLAAVAVMFLWNAVLPAVISGVRPLDFFQALGLLLLSRLLFYQPATPAKKPEAPLPGARRALPEEDRAAFLARIRQRLSEQEHHDPPPSSFS